MLETRRKYLSTYTYLSHHSLTHHVVQSRLILDAVSTLLTMNTLIYSITYRARGFGKQLNLVYNRGSAHSRIITVGNCALARFPPPQRNVCFSHMAECIYFPLNRAVTKTTPKTDTPPNPNQIKYTIILCTITHSQYRRRVTLRGDRAQTLSRGFPSMLKHAHCPRHARTPGPP